MGWQVPPAAVRVILGMAVGMDVHPAVAMEVLMWLVVDRPRVIAQFVGQRPALRRPTPVRQLHRTVFAQRHWHLLVNFVWYQ